MGMGECKIGGGGRQIVTIPIIGYRVSPRLVVS